MKRIGRMSPQDPISSPLSPQDPISSPLRLARRRHGKKVNICNGHHKRQSSLKIAPTGTFLYYTSNIRTWWYFETFCLICIEMLSLDFDFQLSYKTTLILHIFLSLWLSLELKLIFPVAGQESDSTHLLWNHCRLVWYTLFLLNR